MSCVMDVGGVDAGASVMGALVWCGEEWVWCGVCGPLTTKE